MNGERPTAIDLFAGAGGLSLGLEQAGFDLVAAVEYDPIHAATHELNFPHTAVFCRDVAQVTGENLRRDSGLGDRPLDALAGGPPCQGFSLIGHRVLHDPRNSLVFHFLRLALELRPRTFVMENVPGMVTGSHTRLVEELVERFAEAGYRVRLPYRTLNAASYGVPQDRDRLFLFGADARAGVELPEYPSAIARMRGGRRNGNRALFIDLPDGPSVDDALSDLPDVETFDHLFEDDEMPARYGQGSTYARRLRGELDDPDDLSYERRRTSDSLTGCRRARHTTESQERFAATSGGSVEPISRFFKLPLDGVCHTLRAGTASDRGAFSAPRPIHPLLPRCITVREAARLHSYPDWFRFHRTIWHGFRQIGNSVPPLLGRAVGRALVRALGASPKKPTSILSLGPDELAGFDMRRAACHFGVPADTIAPRRRVAVGAR